MRPEPPPDFRPAWWLPGPHLPTLWGRFLRRRPTLAARLERWDTPDGDFLELVRLPAATDTAPRLLMLHGLEGGLRSHYVHGLFAQAADRGWGADLLLFRGCGTEPNRAARFYHSGETGDLAFVLNRLIAETPEAPRLLAGVSLGGNVLLKYLGEREDELPATLVAAAAISVPYDLARGCRHISRGFSRVYDRHFVRSLKRKAERKLEAHPGLFDADRMASVRTLWEFDDAVTAPVHGFANAADYYARSSSLGFLFRVRLPTLLLSAADDPFLPAQVLDAVLAEVRDNACVEVEIHPRGGHVGFVDGSAPWRADYYGERRLMSFLEGQIARRQTAVRPATADARTSGSTVAQ